MESNDTTQHDSTPIGLTSQQMYAIVMKAEGVALGDISEALGVPIDTVKNWFRTGTSTRKYYDDYSFEVTTQIGSDALNRLETMVDEAVDVMYSLMTDKSSSDATRFRASAYIIDTVMPLTKEKIELKEQALAARIRMETGIEHGEDITNDPEQFNRYNDAFNRLR